MADQTKKCTQCSKTLSIDKFKSKQSNKQCRTCLNCRDYYINYKKARNRAPPTTDSDKKYCTQCLRIVPLTDFKSKTNGSESKTCAACREYVLKSLRQTQQETGGKFRASQELSHLRTKYNKYDENITRRKQRVEQYKQALEANPKHPDRYKYKAYIKASSEILTKTINKAKALIPIFEAENTRYKQETGNDPQEFNYNKY
jgi:hypothetical protein